MRSARSSYRPTKVTERSLGAMGVYYETGAAKRRGKANLLLIRKAEPDHAEAENRRKHSEHDRHLQSESVAKRAGENRAKNDTVDAYPCPKATRYCFQLKGF